MTDAIATTELEPPAVPSGFNGRPRSARRLHSSLCRLALAGLICVLAVPSVWATDGYFETGYGMKAEGRGGASIAFSDDAFGGANNPATLAFAINQLSVGLDLFSPRRSSERTGLGQGLDGLTTSRNNWFPIPQLAYNHRLQGDQLALGVTAYANGGMNTTYPGSGFNCGQGEANILCGAGELGVDLEQLVIAPTLAWAFTRNQSIGVSPQIVYQRFAAIGLQAFANTPGVSSQPDRVTNQGHENSFGAGVRVGYYARINDAWSVGATYSTKAYMSRFHRYAGLFANQGQFDLPDNFGVGAAWKPATAWTFGLDYERIDYNGVPSVGNPSTLPAQLGATGGPGFGWHDVNVWKLGSEFHASPRWTLRAGYNHVDNPIKASDVTFNILAPGVVTHHVTFGVTHAFSGGGELTAAYMHAFHNSLSGTSILPVFMGGTPAGLERIAMHEDAIGVQYTWHL